MKKLFVILLNVFALTTFAQNNATLQSNGAAALPSSNPFSTASKLPFGAPPFDKITNEDYQPALEAGINEQLAEVEQIANNTAAPTFENTLIALEKSGQLLSRVNHVFNL